MAERGKRPRDQVALVLISEQCIPCHPSDNRHPLCCQHSSCNRRHPFCHRKQLYIEIPTVTNSPTGSSSTPELQVPEAAISAFVNVSEYLEDHAKELLPAQDQDQELMETDLEDVILDAGKIGGQEGSKDSVDKDEEQFIKIESVDEQQTTSSSRNKEGPRRPSMSAAVGPKNRSQFTDAQEEIGALSRIVAAQEQRINELEEVVAIIKDESRRREFMTTDKYHQLIASLAYFRNSS
ncbi:hypothetical protein BGX29_001903 [Mortierella sp. GBA35]|nr:hypothetical protein BGX29_001903 [Mortierella sp. GBA35]